MVAKTPIKERRMAAALNPNIVRETVSKVDKCMARLQELQYTVSGGNKIVSGIKLSPRSTRGYLRTSIRCKQETLRMKSSAFPISPTGKFQGSKNGEWRRLSLPAMLLGETVVEILQASQFAKEVVSAAAKLSSDPKTPDPPNQRTKRPKLEGTELRSRRAREKQRLRRTFRSECDPQVLARARSRIAFKPTSPPSSRKEKWAINTKPAVVAAHKASPKNRPWGKKTVLFPNPLFHSSSSSPPLSHRQKFYKTRSPIIARTNQKQTPHKFLVKSPSTSLNSQFKSKKAVPGTVLFSPSPEKKAVALPKARRCTFSPSKLAGRLMSPLKSRISGSPIKGRVMSGLKQRPAPVRIIPSSRRA